MPSLKPIPILPEAVFNPSLDIADHELHFYPYWLYVKSVPDWAGAFHSGLARYVQREGPVTHSSLLLEPLLLPASSWETSVQGVGTG